MPTELNRKGDFKNGNPVILPLAGNPVTWTPDPAHFGNSE